MSNLTIRFAARSDIPTLLTFIRELADYEHMSDAVVADSDVMAAWMFERRVAEALLAEEDGRAGRHGTLLPQLFHLAGPCRNLS